MVICCLYYAFQVIIECQTDPAYRESLNWLISRIEAYSAEIKNQLVEGMERSKTFFSNPLSAQAASEFRTIMERCANGESMGDILDAIQKIIILSLKDEKLRDWWSRVNLFTKKVVIVRLLLLRANMSLSGADFIRAWIHSIARVRSWCSSFE